MRRRHFETLRPVCPVCRAGSDTGFALRIAHVAREEGQHILEGALHCTNETCLREFPIVDGIPLIVTNIRQYVSDNILSVCARRELSDFVETMLGDCCGPGSAFDQTRQQLSSYAWDHYGDLDPKENALEASAVATRARGLSASPTASSPSPPLEERAGERRPFSTSTIDPKVANPRPGSMLRCLETGCAEAWGPSSSLPAGPVIDAGCSVGRSSFALAERADGLVLGVDLNFAMLRLASEVLRLGTVCYPRRRVGLVYERREFPARFARSENVDFWACDVSALPFPPGTFGLAVSMNVLDCVSGPRELLVSLGRVLKTGGKAVLTCPYDWSSSATPVEGWLGGHSQRSPLAGSPEAVLRTLLTPYAHPASVNTLSLTAERQDLPWLVRLHERSFMSYKVHLVLATRSP